MKILAFDTSTSYASLALWESDAGQTAYEGKMALGRRHSECLFDAIVHGLAMAGWTREELDAIAVGVGPGSFTGLRVGVATAQGLAFALGCPLFGVNSLDAVALAAPAGPELLAVCGDARKQEVYVGLYRRGTWQSDGGPGRLQPAQALTPPRLMKPQQLAAELGAMGEPVLMVGQGVRAYERLFADALGEAMVLPLIQGAEIPDATNIAYLAGLQAAEGASHQPFEVLPLYIRPSEAEMLIGPPEGGPPLADRLAPDGSVLPTPGGDDPSNPQTPE